MVRILEGPPCQGRGATLVPRFSRDYSTFQTNKPFYFCSLANPSESVLLPEPLVYKRYRGESGSFLSSLSLILAFFKAIVSTM